MDESGYRIVSWGYVAARDGLRAVMRSGGKGRTGVQLGGARPVPEQNDPVLSREPGTFVRQPKMV